MIAYYDHKPPQVEAMGNGKYFYRWDIEEVGLPEDMIGIHQSGNVTMEDAAPVEEEQNPSMWKCKEVVFLPPMSVDNVTALVVESLGIEDAEEIAAIRNEVGLAIIPLDMEAAKKGLRDKIIAYDSSEAVNSFSFGGVTMWLDKATRVGLKLRFEAELALGKETTTLWLNGMNFTLPLSGEGSAMNVLTALELYASASYDVTQMHIARVTQMTTAEEILGYDWTSGYPEKLAF